LVLRSRGRLLVAERDTLPRMTVLARPSSNLTDRP
jgi:hypothetical protein